MKNKIIIILSIIGVLLGGYSAYLSYQQPPAQPPVFNPAANPYADGIYANGIIESYQSNGENINIYSEVTGPVTSVLVAEGQTVCKGTPLLTIDSSVQKATAEQQHAQADAALALLNELKAEPRPEALQVAAAQVENAQANLKNAQDQLDKREAAFQAGPNLAITQDTIDSARNAVKIASTNLEVLQKQYDLVKAGAWSYDIQNQQGQYESLAKAAAASDALLGKYTINAPSDGVVLSVGTSVGSYVSPQGSYETYTGGMTPLIVMGASQDELQVRTYVDEILVHRLPDQSKIQAQMFIRGTNIHIPLTFVRLQPYISPKIELSDQRQERVDVRVLPIIFRFQKPKESSLYPGQLVDVYISGDLPVSSKP